MLGLPPSLLVLLTAATQSFAQHPTALRKMSLDEGEKFMPHYYVFGPAASPLNARAAEEELLLSGNSSAAIPFLPPYPRHYDYQGTGLGARVGEGGRSQEKSREEDSGSSSQLLYRRMREVLSKLQGRQFACPQGTHSCTNIDQPNYCCTTGTTCFVVTNAPNAGNVGCCPDGNNCGVTVGLCTDGSTACPANVGGGCCIPGFVCADIGCVSSTVSVITQSQTTVTSTFISTPSPTTQVITVIVTVTPPGGGAPVTSTTTQTTTAQVSELTSTATDTATSTSNTNTGGVPPYRPTSGTSTEAPTSTASYCPTGFYACLARAGGGCCRTGRDCSTTSCPAPAMTTIETNGATVVVPVTDAEAAAGALPSPTCAAGWFLCGSDAGPIAGCCPSGYACGTASCTISTSTATATVQKEFPSSAPGSKSLRVSSALIQGCPKCASATSNAKYTTRNVAATPYPMPYYQTENHNQTFPLSLPPPPSRNHGCPLNPSD
ncbi:hypothetical protein F4819DRAFT_485770 [Hypoxylon fuscum]|nr:hypothetical protein F4819DRAFT_485770 [Hypoxylon fuscum]